MEGESKVKMISHHGETDAHVRFSFGAIADVQCADQDNRSIPGQPTRFYRSALTHLREAVDFWNNRRKMPLFILQLGDLLDGLNILRGGKDESRRILRNAINECSASNSDFHHVWGNHEMYNFSRLELLNSPLFSGSRYLKSSHPQVHKQLLARTNSKDVPSDPAPPIQILPTSVQTKSSTPTVKDNSDSTFLDERMSAYYDFSPAKGFRFVLLDTFEVSTLGYCSEEGRPVVEEATAILRRHNQNEDLRDPEGLVGLERRFVSTSGGISNKQIAWLTRTLERARNRSERVFIFGHVPICPEVSVEDCLVWNYKEVLKVLRNSGCVVATLFGHTHNYCHHADVAGIHHLVLPGIVECCAGTNGFVTFDVMEDGMLMHRAWAEGIIKLTFPVR